MALDVSLGKCSRVLHYPFSIFRFHLLQKVGIRRIQEKIKLAIAVPIGNGQLPSTALSSRAGIESKWLVAFTDECTLGRFENELLTRFRSLEECQVSFVIQHRDVD